MRSLFVLVALLLGGVFLVRHLERTRPHDLPWTPLDLNAPIGMATGMKLAALAGDPAACRAALAQAGAGYTPLADVDPAGECGRRDAVTLDRSRVAYRPTPVAATCPLIAALVLWERRVAAPAARERFGQELVRVDHYGTFSCRRLYGREGGAFSEHARSNAIDLAAFRLADGTTVSVARDWTGTGARAAFLRDLHDGACRLFGTTLGPDYNAAHRDHFHLDMGGRSCR